MPAVAEIRPRPTLVEYHVRSRHPYNRGDRAVAMIVAAGLIFGTAWFGEHLRHGPPKPKPAEEPPTIAITMPNIDLNQEPAQDLAQTASPSDIAPPMQADVPQVVTDTSFVQPLQPSPPQNLHLTTGVVTIPTNYAGGFAKGMEVFDISKLDQIPEPLYRPQPVYPYAARKNGVSGQAVVEFIVETDGTVSNAIAVSSTDRDFEEPAVSGVSRWRFRPGRRGGHAVRTRMEVPIVFNLDTGAGG